MFCYSNKSTPQLANPEGGGDARILPEGNKNKPGEGDIRYLPIRYLGYSLAGVH